MFTVVQKMHRSLTLRCLNHLLRHKNLQPQYQAVPHSLLYVAASCLPCHISGYTTRTHEIVCALKSSGADVRVLTRPGYPWDRSDALHLPDIEFTTVDGVAYEHARHPSNRRFTALFAAQAAQVIAQRAVLHRVTGIHAASNHVNALPALVAARRLGIPFQYEMRGLWELTRASRMPAFENSHNYNLGLELEGFVAAHADRVFVISEQLGAYAQERWGIPAERLHLLPNCVDAERIKPDPSCAMLPDTIGYAGSLIGYEGLDTLITAVGLCVRQGRSVQLHIMGDGEARPELEALTTSLGLREHVHFFGKLPPAEARTRIAQCALVCIPRKPYKVCEVVPPIKLVEAMALGKPVVVPDLPVFRDEVSQSLGALFFRSGDAEDLARVLTFVLPDAALLAELGASNRAYVMERRQWCHHVGPVSLLGTAGHTA